MKLQASPVQQPRADWSATIRAQRTEIEGLLDDSPSLRREVSSMIARTAPRAQRDVAASLIDHHEEPLIEMNQITYTEDQVLGDWLPPR